MFVFGGGYSQLFGLIYEASMLDFASSLAQSASQGANSAQNYQGSVVETGDSDDQFQVQSDRNRINTHGGNDTATITGAYNSANLGPGNDELTLATTSRFNYVDMGPGASNVTEGGYGNAVCTSGPTTANVSGYGNRLTTSDQDDAVNLTPSASACSVNAGAGNDTVHVGGGQADGWQFGATNFVNGGDGFDSLSFAGSMWDYTPFLSWYGGIGMHNNATGENTVFTNFESVSFDV